MSPLSFDFLIPSGLCSDVGCCLLHVLHVCLSLQCFAMCWSLKQPKHSSSLLQSLDGHSEISSKTVHTRLSYEASCIKSIQQSVDCYLPDLHQKQGLSLFPFLALSCKLKTNASIFFIVIWLANTLL